MARGNGPYEAVSSSEQQQGLMPENMSNMGGYGDPYHENHSTESAAIDLRSSSERKHHHHHHPKRPRKDTPKEDEDIDSFYSDEEPTENNKPSPDLSQPNLLNFDDDTSTSNPAVMTSNQKPSNDFWDDWDGTPKASTKKPADSNNIPSVQLDNTTKIDSKVSEIKKTNQEPTIPSPLKQTSGNPPTTLTGLDNWGKESTNSSAAGKIIEQTSKASSKASEDDDIYGWDSASSKKTNSSISPQVTKKETASWDDWGNADWLGGSGKDKSQ